MKLTFENFKTVYPNMSEDELQKLTSHFSNMESKEIDIDSPLETIKIGDEYDFSGQYIDGYEEGTSKIIRIYKESYFYNGKKTNRTRNSSPDSVFIDLENGKKDLIGFLDYKNRFTLANSKKDKFNKNFQFFAILLGWIFLFIIFSTHTIIYKQRIKPTKMPRAGFELQILKQQTVMKTTIPSHST